MKVRIIRTCAAQGHHLEAGQVVDVPDKVARELVTVRRAVFLHPAIETRDPEIAIGDATERVFDKSRKK